MKPKTKLQHRVVELAYYLQDVSKKVEEWAENHTVKHRAFRLKKGRTACLDCGHIWQVTKDVKTVVCPSCNKKLKVEVTTKTKEKQQTSFAVIDKMKEFQVNRIFEVTKKERVGQPAEFSIYEIIQQWIIPGTDDFEFYARTSGIMGSISYTGPMEIRTKNMNRYNYNPWFVYPKVKLHDIYKRNGLKNNFYGCSPFRIMQSILSDPKVETLFKTGYGDLLGAYLYTYKGSSYFPSIKIAIRNGYKIEDVKMWFDYLELLEHFNKDLLNAKYVCPDNLRKAHDELVELKRKRDERLRIENERRWARKEAEERARQEMWKQPGYYESVYAPYLNLKFKSGNITITPLQNVEEFYEEGKELHHCIATNAYWAKENSLCLSAKIDGVRVETIEINLKGGFVSQCHGARNFNSTSHEDILDLMNRNLKTVLKIYQRQQNTKKKKGKLLIENAA